MYYIFYVSAWLFHRSGLFHFKGYKGKDSTCCLRVDDQHFKQDIYKTATKLFNGDKIPTMGSGTKEPMATTAISAKLMMRSELS